ncbi:MAG: GatB/YqeY domain-containing protein [Candidatus Nanoarchaeia archaeon]
MSLFKKISEDLQKALKDKDTIRLETLRMMKSKILLVDARGNLEDKEIIKILSKYSKTLREAIEEARKVNRLDVAEKTEKELSIVEEYLPKQLSEAEIREIVKKTIVEVNATSIKDMGKVIKKIMSERADVDGKIVKDIVTEELSGK